MFWPGDRWGIGLEAHCGEGGSAGTCARPPKGDVGPPRGGAAQYSRWRAGRQANLDEFVYDAGSSRYIDISLWTRHRHREAR